MDTSRCQQQEIRVVPTHQHQHQDASTPPATSINTSFPQTQSNTLAPQHPNQIKNGINCRRCTSSNTKFCYYNNYSLSQPRYFCKTCKRYWTEGGSLRNIPVGGLSRKTTTLKRSSSPSHSSPNKMLLQHPHHTSSNRHHLLQLSPPPSVQPPHARFQSTPNLQTQEQIFINRHDLHLGLIPSSEGSVLKTFTQLIQVPDFDENGEEDNTLLQQQQQQQYPNSYLSMPSYHDDEEDRRRAGMLFPFQEMKQQVERKTCESLINGGGLESGLW